MNRANSILGVFFLLVSGAALADGEPSYVHGLTLAVDAGKVTSTKEITVPVVDRLILRAKGSTVSETVNFNARVLITDDAGKTIFSGFLYDDSHLNGVRNLTSLLSKNARKVVITITEVDFEYSRFSIRNFSDRRYLEMLAKPDVYVELEIKTDSRQEASFDKN